jgi:hypothetical protein
MKGVTRSRFIGYSTAIAALPAMAAARAQSLTAVRAGAIGDDQATPFLYAASSGIFKRYGIDGKLTRTASLKMTEVPMGGALGHGEPAHRRSGPELTTACRLASGAGL